MLLFVIVLHTAADTRQKQNMDSNLIAIRSAGEDMIKTCGVVKAPAIDLRFDFLFVLFCLCF